MTDTDNSPEGTGLPDRLREAASLRLADTPSAAHVRRRGDRRRSASRAIVVTAALALFGGTAATALQAGPLGFHHERGTVGPAATGTPSTQPSSSPEGKKPATPAFRVVVDTERHRLTAYSADKVLRTIPITAGADGTPTPEGRYTVQEKAPVFRATFPGFDAGYEIELKWHVTLDESNVSLTSSYWLEDESVYGSENVTHGIVGLQATDAKWLYRNLDVGDTVVIRD